MNRPHWMLENARSFDRQRRKSRLRKVNWPLLVLVAGSLAAWAAIAWVFA